MKNYTWGKFFADCIIFVIGVTLGTGVYIAAHSLRSVTIEAGQPLEVSLFWNGAWPARFSDDTLPVDTTVIGSYPLSVQLNSWYSYPVLLTVRDTTAPVIVAQDVELNYGYECSIEDFIASSEDVTELTFTYQEEPDFLKPGLQEVRIVAADAAGNETVVAAELFITNIREQLTIEMGNPVPSVQDYLIEPEEDARYLEVPSYLDGLTPGQYEVRIALGGEEYTARLTVADTRAPRGESVSVEGWRGEELAPEAFVTNIWDASDVTVSFVEEPDWESESLQEIELELKDAAGNTGYVYSELRLHRDTEPPLINGTDINVTVGGTISYRRSITVSDNHDAAEDITLEINADAVDLANVGDYPVYCTATDLAGNKTEQEVTVHVNPEQVITYDAETVYALADQVLAQIITDDMTPEEKATAIYQWAHSHIAYINHMDKGDWLKVAYITFTTRKGDCYGYACVCMAMLNRVGIENMLIHKEITPQTSQSNHYWNLVNFGYGWLHLDATPRRGGPDFCLVTDAYILEYSNAHHGSHNFTRELYPPIL